MGARSLEMALISMLGASALHASEIEQMQKMPNLNAYGKPTIIRGQYGGSELITKVYRNNREQVFAWYAVCFHKPKRPFAIALVKHKNPKSVKVFIDNKGYDYRINKKGNISLRVSDGKPEFVFSDYTSSKPIVSYVPRCF